MAQIYKIDTDQHQQRRRDDSRIRLSVARNAPEWDEEWGGPCPYSTDESRRKLGLRELNPPPLHKRIRRWYAENWEQLFYSAYPAIVVTVLTSIAILVFVQLGKLTGWWGGVM